MNYQNLKNRQTANLAVFGRFWAVFGLFLGCLRGYLAIYLDLKSFHHQKLIILLIMNFQNLKNRQTANLSGFGRFWAVLVGFWAVLVAF